MESNQGGRRNNDIGMDQMVVNQQPLPSENWMQKPLGIVNCPPGLEYLTTLDQVLIQQKINLLKAFTGWETRNKFILRNSLGQIAFNAQEESDCLTRYCLGRIRPYEVNVMNNLGHKVMWYSRRFACQGCCCPCYLQKVEAFCAPDTLIGTIEQEWSIIYPRFRICDALGNVVLRVKGPFFTCSYSCNDVIFKVYTENEEEEVGTISKQWSGFTTEYFTDADNFGVTFPINLDVRTKATLLGAVFLINSMYYER